MGKRGPRAATTKPVRGESTGYLKPDRDLSPAAKKVWDQVVKSMAPGFYSEIDRSLLRIYSHLSVNLEKAQAEVDKMGVVIKTGYEQIAENPWFKASLKLSEALARLAVKLKISKSSSETHRATAKASRAGLPETSSFRKGLLYDNSKHVVDQFN